MAHGLMTVEITIGTGETTADVAVITAIVVATTAVLIIGIHAITDATMMTMIPYVKQCAKQFVMQHVML